MLHGYHVYNPGLTHHGKSSLMRKLGGILFLSQCNYNIKFLQLNNLPDFYSDIEILAKYEICLQQNNL